MRKTLALLLGVLTVTACMDSAPKRVYMVRFRVDTVYDVIAVDGTRCTDVRGAPPKINDQLPCTSWYKR